jgi:hypothetical protein
VCIDVFPESKTILPEKIMRDRVTWGDARGQRDKYAIQFSAASSLSKDPDKKMVQVQSMINGGFIDKSMASHFMQLPDLEGVFTIAGANYDAIQKIIKDTIEGDTTEYWQTVDLQALKGEIVKKMNVLIAADDDEKYIGRLGALLKQVNQEQKDVADYINAPPPPPPPEPLKDKSMDSGQITGLLAILDKVNTHGLSMEQAGAVIGAAYPDINPDTLAKLIKPMPAPLAQAAGIPGASPPGGMGASILPPPAPAPAPAGNLMTGATNG